MEPDLAAFLLELQIGIQGVGILFSAIEGAGGQVAVLLVSRPVGARAGIRIRVFVVDAHRGFHVLDAGGVDIHAQLRRRGESLVQESGFAFLVPGHHNHVGIVHVLAVGNDGHLVFLAIGRHQGVGIPEQPPLVPERVVLVLLPQCGAALEGGIAEPAFLVFLLERHVQHLFPAAVLQARIPGPFRLPVDDADLVHHGSGQVVERRALVVEEEGAAAHGELVNLLTVELHLAVFRDFHARHAQQQVLEHGIGPHPEGRGVELHRIFLDDDGIAHIGHGGGLQELLVHLEPDGAQIHFLFPEIPFPGERLVSQHLHVEDIAAEGHFVQFGLAFGVREGEVGDGGVLGRDDVHRRKGNGLLGKGIQDGGLDFTHPPAEHALIEDDHLRPRRKAEAQQQGKGRKKFFHAFSD